MLELDLSSQQRETPTVQARGISKKGTLLISLRGPCSEGKCNQPRLATRHIAAQRLCADADREGTIEIACA